MKKILLFVSALAGLFLAGSCQREELAPVEEAGVVTFEVNVPGVATKGIGDDLSKINNLVYDVYWTEKSVDEVDKISVDDLTLLYQDTKQVVSGNSTVSVELLKDKNYVILFWAQRGDTWKLVGKELKDGISYPTKYFANAEKLEAFSGVSVLTKEQLTGTKEVTLYRPFAQLNVGTTVPDYYKEDVVLTESAVTVKNAGASFNLIKQCAEGNQNVKFVTAAVPSGVLKANNSPYNYAAMNYIFANGNVDVKIEITTANHGTISLDEIPAVPVEKNYRTNIIGNLLTSDVKYNVELDQDWGPEGDVDDDYIVEVVSTASGLQDAINNASEGVQTEIKLDGDIDLNDLAALLATPGTLSTKAAAPTYGLQIPYGKTIVLDLNGLTLSQELSQTAGYSMIINDGELVITDSKGTGKISYKDAGNGGNYVSNTITNRGTLTIKGGTIENVTSEAAANIGFAYTIDTSIWGDASEVVVNIEGGTIKSIYSPLRLRADSVTKEIVGNISGGDIYGRVDHQMSSSTAGVKATLTITGGKFHSYGIKPDHNIKIFGAGVDTDASGIRLSITGGEFDKGFEIDHGQYVPLGKGFNEQFITGGEFAFNPTANVPDAYKVEEQNGKYVVVKKPDVAKIGYTGYWSLNAAVAAVQDGETITLVADETFTKTNRTHNSGDWYDGLYYIGDKSFTIDLGGKTISQDGAVNDYLLNFKNDGTKANEITLKNGTIDAGTAAFCALCTASTSTKQLTINLEKVNLINNMSNGSTIKLRGRAVLNVKDGAKITGKNSYLGIECVASTVNIYDGAQIYMNGTSSYNGCLVGACGGGIVNVYGGYGKGVKGGFIAMTSGGTINISGGEWIANTDGTIGDNSNLYVLTAQSNIKESGFVGGAYINVTGGTFRGGMDAWVLNNDPEEKAELNIKGGNFNANPKSYLVDGYKVDEVNGIYTVLVDPAAKIGETEYATLQEALNVGGNVTLLRDVNVAEPLILPEGKTALLDLNGKTLKGTMHKSLGHVVRNNGTLTIKNGTVSSTANNGGSAVMNTGTLTVENVTLNGAPNADGSWPSYTVNNTGVATITNTTITSYHGAVASYNKDALVTLKDSEIAMAGIPGFTNHGIYTYNDGAVVVNGGTYANNATDQASTGGSVINGAVTVNAGTFSGRIENYGGTPVLKGGTYSVKPNKNFVAEGYAVTDNADGTWTVAQSNE